MIRVGIQGYSLDTAQIQGHREEQEDRYVISVDENGGLFAIFDGHGGPECAQKAQDYAGDIWRNLSADEPETALKDWVKELADITSEFQTEGCTLSAVFIPKDALNAAYTATLGDSPILVRDEWGIVRTAPDHNIRRNDWELKAALNRGGLYSGGYLHVDPYGPGLQMGRALGDGWMGPVISKEPEINVFNLGQQPGDFVLIGSDGIFDLGVWSIQDEIERVTESILELGDGAQDIALTGDPDDNATVILLRRN